MVPDPGKKQYERRSDNSGDFRGKYGLRNVCKLVIIKLVIIKLVIIKLVIIKLRSKIIV